MSLSHYSNSPEITSIMTRNRRKFPRVSLSCEAFIETHNEHFTLPVTNLSFAGAYFETSNQLPLNFQLTLTWENNGGVHKAVARVVRQDQHGFAVAFTAPSSAFINQTCQIIWQNIKGNGIPQGLLSGKEQPGSIALFLNKHHEYEPVFTLSLDQRMVWILSDSVQFDSEAFWVTLPEHGLFDCKAKVIPTFNTNVTGIEFIKPSEEFETAYRRILESHQL